MGRCFSSWGAPDQIGQWVITGRRTLCSWEPPDPEHKVRGCPAGGLHPTSAEDLGPGTPELTAPRTLVLGQQQVGRWNPCEEALLASLPGGSTRRSCLQALVSVPAGCAWEAKPCLPAGEGAGPRWADTLSGHQLGVYPQACSQAESAMLAGLQTMCWPSWASSEAPHLSWLPLGSHL